MNIRSWHGSVSIEQIYGKTNIRVNAVRAEVNALLNSDKYVTKPEDIAKLKRLSAETKQKSNKVLVEKLRSILGGILKDD